MSGAGTSARAPSATSARLPWSLRTGPASVATKTVSAPGSRPRSLVRTDGVEGGEAVEEQDRDLHQVVPCSGWSVDFSGFHPTGAWKRRRVLRRCRSEGLHEGPAHGLGLRNRTPGDLPRLRRRCSSRSRRACSRRTRSTYRPGGMPVSAWKARAKCRGDIRARAASDSTERSAAGCSVTHRWTSRSGSRRAVCADSWALNCAWFSRDRRKTTRWRAMVEPARPGRGPPRPRASARSIPAVTPADVAEVVRRVRRSGAGRPRRAG